MSQKWSNVCKDYRVPDAVCKQLFTDACLCHRGTNFQRNCEAFADGCYNFDYKNRSPYKDGLTDWTFVFWSGAWNSLQPLCDREPKTITLASSLAQKLMDSGNQLEAFYNPPLPAFDATTILIWKAMSAHFARLCLQNIPVSKSGQNPPSSTSGSVAPGQQVVAAKDDRPVKTILMLFGRYAPDTVFAATEGPELGKYSKTGVKLRIQIRLPSNFNAAGSLIPQSVSRLRSGLKAWVVDNVNKSCEIISLHVNELTKVPMDDIACYYDCQNNYENCIKWVNDPNANANVTPARVNNLGALLKMGNI
eukprot:GILI01003518.1.p2 GENE.GILI01003518.1~~GILI01003518.1.p2  ORF type:complete len:306 (+),score=96.23 GILI01003518.1:1909-2826(+)